jgi:hypothetical protein
MILSTPRQQFGRLSQNPGQQHQEQAWFQVGHISWTQLYFVTKIIALQLVTLSVFLSHVLSKTKMGRFCMNRGHFLGSLTNYLANIIVNFTSLGKII